MKWTEIADNTNFKSYYKNTDIPSPNTPANENSHQRKKNPQTENCKIIFQNESVTDFYIFFKNLEPKIKNRNGQNTRYETRTEHAQERGGGIEKKTNHF